MKVRKMRLLRMKHNISCPELGKSVGLSPQRISELELGNTSVEYATIEKIQAAFCAVIDTRTEALHTLMKDYAKYKHDLVNVVEEQSYEL